MVFLVDPYPIASATKSLRASLWSKQRTQLTIDNIALSIVSTIFANDCTSIRQVVSMMKVNGCVRVA
jgi:hypothetical protein